MSPDDDRPAVEARSLLYDAERVRNRARRDRHASSVPLIAFGLLVGVYAFVQLVLGLEPPFIGGTDEVTDPVTGEVLGTNETPDLFGLLPWAVPATLALMACWYWRQRVVTGVGYGRVPLLVLALLAFPLALLPQWDGLPFQLAMVLVLATALLHPAVLNLLFLLVFATVQRQWYVAAWAGGAMVVLALESFAFWDNGLYKAEMVLHVDLPRIPGGLVVALAAAALLWAGGRAWRHEARLP
jgi:hypothetical protein